MRKAKKFGGVDPALIKVSCKKFKIDLNGNFTEGAQNLGGRERTRMIARIRDKFTCQDCKKVRTPLSVKRFNSKIQGLKGRIKLFDVHHLKGKCGEKSRKYDKLSAIPKLTTLCHECHYNRHDFSQRKKNKLWGVVKVKDLYKFGLTKKEYELKFK